MLYLMGKGEWKTLKQLVEEGVYDHIVSDKTEMSSIITFAVNFNAPTDVLHFLCHLNPDALTVQDLPFRLARRNGFELSPCMVVDS
jgi:hypothetical protein